MVHHQIHDDKEMVTFTLLCYTATSGVKSTKTDSILYF